MTRQHRLSPRLGLWIIVALCVGNVGFCVSSQMRAKGASDLDVNDTDEIALLLDREIGSSQRRVFAFYQLVDYYLTDGTEVRVSQPLRGHVFWLRHTGAVDARAADGVLPLSPEQRTQLEGRSIRATALGEATAWLVIDPGAESYLLAGETASGDVYLVPSGVYRALTHPVAP